MYSKEYYQQHKEIIFKKHKEYIEKNKDKINEYYRNYRKSKKLLKSRENNGN